MNYDSDGFKKIVLTKSENSFMTMRKNTTLELIFLKAENILKIVGYI